MVPARITCVQKWIASTHMCTMMRILRHMRVYVCSVVNIWIALAVELTRFTRRRAENYIKFYSYWVHTTHVSMSLDSMALLTYSSVRISLNWTDGILFLVIQVLDIIGFQANEAIWRLISTYIYLNCNLIVIATERYGANNIPQWEKSGCGQRIMLLVYSHVIWHITKRPLLLLRTYELHMMTMTTCVLP